MADPRFPADAPENDDEALQKRLLMMQMQDEAPPEPAVPEAQPTTAPAEEPPPVADPTAPPEATASPTSQAFQSHHGTVSGYLQDAMRAYQPTVQAAKSEQEAKQLAQQYIQSLVPEIQKRGGNVGDIKNEKIQIDGKWVDLYRDIGGASEAQYLVDDGGGGGGQLGIDTMMPALVNPDAGQNVVGTSLPTDQNTYAELMRRIQEILGPEATDRQALLTQMKA